MRVGIKTKTAIGLLDYKFFFLPFSRCFFFLALSSPFSFLLFLLTDSVFLSTFRSVVQNSPHGRAEWQSLKHRRARQRGRALFFLSIFPPLLHFCVKRAWYISNNGVSSALVDPHFFFDLLEKFVFIWNDGWHGALVCAVLHLIVSPLSSSFFLFFLFISVMYFLKTSFLRVLSMQGGGEGYRAFLYDGPENNKKKRKWALCCFFFVFYLWSYFLCTFH